MIKVNINKAVLELIEGDITEQETDAIVNAANSSLLGGGGVDGAIHRAGGPKILEDCRKLGGCPTGEARITTGGNLKAKYVIHTVGPVYSGGNRREAELLANAYKNSLKLASQYKLKSISFPSISTGAYGYPLDEAATVALKTVTQYLKTHADIELVRFVLFGQKAYQAYDKALQELVK
ncbi:MAG: O-acetyl-ADP-ribose deacetylase [Planctomycetes bacterium]|nr:O-acetyl-ADP-ribose deacetylase [Planctomycetota bacterium]